MSASLPALTPDELIARLEAGHAAQVTVVTPNRRLAQALAGAFDRRQIATGRDAWDTADILPYSAFVERLYDDALHSEHAAGLPLLLTPDQEQSLWEDIVRRSAAGDALLAIAETAALAAGAWQLAHAYRLVDRLDHASVDADSRAFADWATTYLHRTGRDRLTDRARLPEVVAGRLGQAWMKKPALLVAYGFDVVTPQQRFLLDALAGNGVELATSAPARLAGSARRFATVDARDEMRQAARWARARLESNGEARIAIVVPDLAGRKRALRHALAETLDPAGTGATLPFNVSLGEPLTAYPLVAHALVALALGGAAVEFERASLLVRSPFIAGAESELQRRARLDARLRKRAEPEVTLERLAGLIEDVPALARTLANYAAFRRQRLSRAQSPGDWARAFSEALSLVGFPGERGLDSAEYQTLKKWHDVVTRLAGLDRVVAKLSFDEALARLRGMASETLFQPETPEVPIQVLGVLEAAGMTFDHLWVMGLDDEAWPMHSRANPFVPLRLQREANVPGVSPAATLERAKALTAEWLGSAKEVLLSHPLREQDRALAASALIAHLPERDLRLPDYPTWRDAIRRGAMLEHLADAQAPALVAGEALSGGQRLIQDQAACPFRAFAVHRLGAQALEAPHTGLDARERGTLVHRVLAGAWRQIGSRQALETMDATVLDSLLTSAAEEAMARVRRDRPTTLAGRFAAIERSRLAHLARDWLEVDRAREDFTVVATEDKRAVEIGPLRFSVRLDRVDETAAGARIVIDYKTGKANATSMLGERPDEPQLPLYLSATEPDAAAVAFAQVRVGEMRYVGLARDDGLLAGAKSPRSGWDGQRTIWRAVLERLAGDFAAGRAAVDPKSPPQTCGNCDLQPLCRIAERSGGAAKDGE